MGSFFSTDFVLLFGVGHGSLRCILVVVFKGPACFACAAWVWLTDCLLESRIVFSCLHVRVCCMCCLNHTLQVRFMYVFRISLLIEKYIIDGFCLVFVLLFFLPRLLLFFTHLFFRVRPAVFFVLWLVCSCFVKMGPAIGAVCGWIRCYRRFPSIKCRSYVGKNGPLSFYF